MKHIYNWTTDDYGRLIIYEDNCVMATVENEDIDNISDEALEELFKEVVYEMREINLDMEDV